MHDGRLTALLHLCDSLFPTGSYAHSDGLEAATASGLVATAAAVREWVASLLDETLAYTDGPAIALASEAFTERRWTDLRELDDELNAQRPSSTSRDASRSIGTRLLTTWCRLHPHADLEALVSSDRRDGWTLPVAFSAASASMQIDARTTMEAFMFTRILSAASAAMRLMSLGQLEAHGIVADALARVPGVCDAVMLRRDRPSSFAPLADIASMRQQYVTSRLFRS